MQGTAGPLHGSIVTGVLAQTSYKCAYCFYKEFAPQRQAQEFRYANGRDLASGGDVVNVWQTWKHRDMV